MSGRVTGCAECERGLSLVSFLDHQNRPHQYHEIKQDVFVPCRQHRRHSGSQSESGNGRICEAQNSREGTVESGNASAC